MICYDSQHNRMILEGALDRGGEAVIYRVRGQEDVVAKIYHNLPQTGYEQKLTWMQRHPPRDPSREAAHPSIAWPRHLLYNHRNQLAGYLMPFVNDTVKLISVINPNLRHKTIPAFNWKYLHRTARNIAAAVSALHERDYVIGDLNESNIMVAPSAMVTFIDTDSFQVFDQGKRMLFCCPVGKPEYTPAELQGVDFCSNPRNKEADFFGLAVLVFQLLLEGSHPFRGKWIHSGDPPPVPDKIFNGWFPYGKDHGPNLPPPNSPGLDVLHPAVKQLIMRCFVDGGKNPARRPSPEMWIDALETAEASLKSCPRGHYYSRHLKTCPWCNRTTSLFITQVSRMVKPRPKKPRQTPLLSIYQTAIHFGQISLDEIAQRQLLIKNTGKDTLIGVATSNSGWLKVRPAALHLKPGEYINLMLSIDTHDLNISTQESVYTALLNIQSNGGRQQVQVQARLGLPVMHVDQQVLAFGNCTRGKVVHSSFMIKNKGSGILNGVVSTLAKWMSVPQPNFSCMPGAEVKVQLLVNTEHHADFPSDGLYTTPVSVRTNDGSHILRAQLNIVSPRLSLQSEPICLGPASHGDPTSCRLVLNNTGSGELLAKLSSKTGWLTIEPKHLWIQPGMSGDVLLTAQTNKLKGAPHGKTHKTTLLVESNGGDQTVPVQLIVGSPKLKLRQKTLHLGRMAKGDQAKSTLVINNAGIGKLIGFINTGVPWLSIEPARFVCPPNAERILEVAINSTVSGIPLGKEANIVIPINTNAGKNEIEVKFRVDAPLLKVYANNEEIHASSIADGSLKTHIMIANAGKAVLSAGIEFDVPWLAAETPQVDVTPERKALVWLAIDPHGIEKESGKDNNSFERSERGKSRTANLLIRSNGGEQKVTMQVDTRLMSMKVIQRAMTISLAPGVEMSFVHVPASDFIMGNPAFNDLDDPRHDAFAFRLYLDDFWMGKYPVTNAQYKAFIDASGALRPKLWDIFKNPPQDKTDHPIVYVHWAEALAFCRWLTEISGYRIDLPSETEWEKAARGSDGRYYPWGNASPSRRFCNYESEDTTPVSKYIGRGTSPYGCEDMSGNVWEWTSSSALSLPFHISDKVEEPDQESSRILRGGSWFNTSEQISATSRLASNSLQSTGFSGFRCMFRL